MGKEKAAESTRWDPTSFPAPLPFFPAADAFLQASHHDETSQQQSSVVALTYRSQPIRRSHVRPTSHIWRICRKQTPVAQQHEPETRCNRQLGRVCSAGMRAARKGGRMLLGDAAARSSASDSPAPRQEINRELNHRPSHW